jgi:hypothetical protein
MNNIQPQIKDTMSTQEIMTWSKEIKLGRLTKKISVEKLKGGFLTTISKYGYETEDKECPYIDSNDRFVSDYNPLEKVAEKEDDSVDNKSSVMDSIKEFGDFLIG